MLIFGAVGILNKAYLQKISSFEKPTRAKCGAFIKNKHDIDHGKDEEEPMYDYNKTDKEGRLMKSIRKKANPYTNGFSLELERALASH